MQAPVVFLLVVALAATTCSALSSGARGIDIAYGLFTQTEWDCLQTTNSHVFAIIEAWRGINGYNTNVKANTEMALLAGFSEIDYYFYPTVKTDAATQVLTCIELESNFGR